MTNLFRVKFVAVLLLLGGCATERPPVVSPAVCPPVVMPPPVSTPSEPVPVAPNLQLVEWNALPGWRDDKVLAAWDSWLQSCSALKAKPDWQSVCAAALTLKPTSDEEVRAFFQARFNVYQSLQADGSADGLMTGYYEPLLFGSRTPSAALPIPLYTAPRNLLTMVLYSVYPALKSLRLRGRLVGN